MGSPVSAVIANLYMDSFEEQAISTSSYKPRIWKRYGNDTFIIIHRRSVHSFLPHLNNHQPSIRFTMETENDNKLAFLDTAVSREPDGHLTTSVYKKPTHTDQLLCVRFTPPAISKTRILHRGSVDNFLHHLNNHQPSIRFNMETENDNKLDEGSFHKYISSE